MISTLSPASSDAWGSSMDSIYMRALGNGREKAAYAARGTRMSIASYSGAEVFASHRLENGSHIHDNLLDLEPSAEEKKHVILLSVAGDNWKIIISGLKSLSTLSGSSGTATATNTYYTHPCHAAIYWSFHHTAVIANHKWFAMNTNPPAVQIRADVSSAELRKSQLEHKCIAQVIDGISRRAIELSVKGSEGRTVDLFTSLRSQNHAALIRILRGLNQKLSPTEYKGDLRVFRDGWGSFYLTKIRYDEINDGEKDIRNAVWLRTNDLRHFHTNLNVDFDQ
ncbi:hypothetical protein ASPWEDRAFT_170571 [Aspergillus wentii DTO 134E9]|uniref:Uncharacterized protein n=1 Tax=Aspergillus wentii DTO 134E9 TaxID=1073089 RepID=A0A1L9RQH9_ASPWE|nr:uncharacterized protein ASPWEDRAFT_170571 [Aspergillus wentii DTO 134E9]OJJ37078.1 hypothetical protein ASPWEDRAFT_170571 [Aspergillus wentii DTO 134E9]